MYFEIFDLIMSWLFSGGTVTSEINMVCTFLATLSTLAVYVVPFVVVGLVVVAICRVIK